MGSSALGSKRHNRLRICHGRFAKASEPRGWGLDAGQDLRCLLARVGTNGIAECAGGNSGPEVRQLAQQLLQKQLGVDPGFDRFGKEVGELVQSGDRLVAFVVQLDLPAQPIEQQKLVVVQLAVGHRGKDYQYLISG